MRELPEPDGEHDRVFERGTVVYKKESVLAIQKQAYEDGLRDAIPDGYVLAPIIPTWDMQIAASTAYREARDGHYTARMEQARDCWAAMLTASQKEQQ